jgi:hypothetical protein
MGSQLTSTYQPVTNGTINFLACQMYRKVCFDLASLGDLRSAGLYVSDIYS